VKVLCNFVNRNFWYVEFIEVVGVVLRVFIVKSMKMDVVDFVYFTRKFI